MATVGQNINGYIILKELTNGGFCTSYEVQKGAVSYFMKEYTDPTKMSPVYRSFVDNQNRMIPKLKALGNNIEKIVDSFETKYRYFQVKEYIYGENLKEWMSKHTGFSVRRSLAIQMCEAILAIHKLDIIHQDLKPEQFMVVVDGSMDCSFRLILTDFDWSIPDGNIVKKVGTTFYSKIDTDCSYKTDILTLGIMLSELLVGRTPYKIDTSLVLDEDESSKYWKKLVQNKEYDTPLSINPTNISSYASDIIVKCLNPIPKDRPEIIEIIDAVKKDKYSFKPIISTVLIPTPSLDASVSVHISAPSPSLPKRIASIDVFKRVIGGVKDTDVILVKKPEFMPLDASIKLQSPYEKLLQRISSIGDIFRK